MVCSAIPWTYVVFVQFVNLDCQAVFSFQDSPWFMWNLDYIMPGSWTIDIKFLKKLSG